MSEEITSTQEPTGYDNQEPLKAKPEQGFDKNYVDSKVRSLVVMNIILIVAVISLFVLYLVGKPSHPKSSVAATATPGSSLKIAFVNNDSILTSYNMVTKMRSDLQAKSKRLEDELAAKQKAFDKDAAYFQEQVKKKALSDQSAQEIYAQLTQEQQKINDLRQRYSAELQQNEMEMNVVLLDSVTNYLKRFNSANGYDYVLGFSKGGNILLKNHNFDITGNVLDGLNNEYKAKAK